MLQVKLDGKIVVPTMTGEAEKLAVVDQAGKRYALVQKGLQLRAWSGNPDENAIDCNVVDELPPAAGLTPPDLARCQGEKVERAPFALGGTHRRTRCSNTPTVVATERKPGADGQRGSMSLCEECRAALLRQAGDDFAIFEPVAAA
jgi:hypothetical protein